MLYGAQASSVPSPQGIVVGECAGRELEIPTNSVSAQAYMHHAFHFTRPDVGMKQDCTVA